MCSKISICALFQKTFITWSVDKCNYKEQNIRTFANAVKLQAVRISNIDLKNENNSASVDEKLANTFDSSNFKFKRIQNAVASLLSYLIIIIMLWPNNMYK